MARLLESSKSQEIEQSITLGISQKEIIDTSKIMALMGATVSSMEQTYLKAAKSGTTLLVQMRGESPEIVEHIAFKPDGEYWYQYNFPQILSEAVRFPRDESNVSIMVNLTLREQALLDLLKRDSRLIQVFNKTQIAETEILRTGASLINIIGKLLAKEGGRLNGPIEIGFGELSRRTGIPEIWGIEMSNGQLQEVSRLKILLRAFSDF